MKPNNNRNNELPRILREATGPGLKESGKEFLNKNRKKAAEKVGRFIASKTFDTSWIDSDFASYETNLRETHYQERHRQWEHNKETVKYRARLMGAYARYLPGVNYIADSIQISSRSRERTRHLRAGYKREHGTFISNTRSSLAENYLRIKDLKSAKPTP